MAHPSRRHVDQASRQGNGQIGKAALKELRLDSPESTFALGERIGRQAAAGTTIALRGGLGAGQTLLTKGIARGLDIEDEVTSPTYTIISEYEGRLRLHHIDAWRLLGAEDFDSIGGDDIVADPRGITVIEWSERIEGALPPDRITIELVLLDGDARMARFEGAFDDRWLA